MGQYEGYGVICLSNGSIYEGMFSKGQMRGAGRLIDFDGNVYEG